MEVNNWVSMLKENADRTMSTVNYTLLSSSGPSHNPVFTYRAELRGEGSASRQGLAKARAAKDLMARVGGGGPLRPLRLGPLQLRQTSLGPDPEKRE
uniref:DRBM domain-containing protein n=1 Tax=Scophthalmus maximus TaxID=52904 RepID=A0A8D3AYL8_SCOMX